MSSRCTISASGTRRCTRAATQSAFSGPRPGTDSRPAGLRTTSIAASRWISSMSSSIAGIVAGTARA